MYKYLSIMYEHRFNMAIKGRVQARTRDVHWIIDCIVPIALILPPRLFFALA
jgi:hypothetical protein